MNPTNVKIIILSAKVKCPLCDEEFRCKINLRKHLYTHSDEEAEEFYKLKNKKLPRFHRAKNS